MIGEKRGKIISITARQTFIKRDMASATTLSCVKSQVVLSPKVDPINSPHKKRPNALPIRLSLHRVLTQLQADVLSHQLFIVGARVKSMPSSQQIWRAVA